MCNLARHPRPSDLPAYAFAQCFDRLFENGWSQLRTGDLPVLPPVWIPGVPTAAYDDFVAHARRTRGQRPAVSSLACLLSCPVASRRHRNLRLHAGLPERDIGYPEAHSQGAHRLGPDKFVNFFAGQSFGHFCARNPVTTLSSIERSCWSIRAPGGRPSSGDSANVRRLPCLPPVPSATPADPSRNSDPDPTPVRSSRGDSTACPRSGRRRAPHPRPAGPRRRAAPGPAPGPCRAGRHPPRVARRASRDRAEPVDRDG
jgi:hypothetical protein